MKKKKRILLGAVVLGIIVLAIGLLTQSPKWSQRSFEAVVKEIITQPDGEVRFIVERTTEIYGDPIHSLGISKDTKLLSADDKKITVRDIQLKSFVKVTLKDAFNEETPFYYPIVYEIKLLNKSQES